MLLCPLVKLEMLPLFQIERCIALLRANPGASRRFYQLAVAHLSVTDVAKFILSIHTAVLQCVSGDGVEGEGRGAREQGDGEREEEEEDMESSEASSDKGAQYVYSSYIHTAVIACVCVHACTIHTVAYTHVHQGDWSNPGGYMYICPSPPSP